MKRQLKSRFAEIDLTNLRTYPMSDLARKVESEAFVEPVFSTRLRGRATGRVSFSDFADSLPNLLAARDLREFSRIIANAVRDKKALIMMFGGHIIKTGLAPLLIDWMQRGYITALATHGAGAIHDTEIALFGRTSEDVVEGLADGSFGMSRDTADFINNAIKDAKHAQLGYGEALAQALLEAKAPNAELSILSASLKSNVPLTVHIAIGTDIVHQHLSADGAAIGRASLKDFRIFAAQVAKLNKGAVVMNLGSAVILPEVFLKALTIVRNLGYPAHNFNAANFDMFTHYRPMQNVLIRPTLTGGHKFNFCGHHEIMIPLLFAMVDANLNDNDNANDDDDDDDDRKKESKW